MGSVSAAPPVVEPVRHRDARARGQQHALRECAWVVVREAERDELGARDQEGDRDDEVAGRDRDAVSGGTELEHLGHVLVAHHEVAFGVEPAAHTSGLGDVEHVMRLAQGVEVGAADPARLHRDQGVALARLRLADVLHQQLPCPCDCCPHATSIPGA